MGKVSESITMSWKINKKKKRIKIREKMLKMGG